MTKFAKQQIVHSIKAFNNTAFYKKSINQSLKSLQNLVSIKKVTDILLISL